MVRDPMADMMELMLEPRDSDTYSEATSFCFQCKTKNLSSQKEDLHVFSDLPLDFINFYYICRATMGQGYIDGVVI